MRPDPEVVTKALQVLIEVKNADTCVLGCGSHHQVSEGGAFRRSIAFSRATLSEVSNTVLQRVVGGML